MTIRNRWPTPAEVDAHPEGRLGWWVLSFDTFTGWEPHTFDGLGILEQARLSEWPTPDAAFAVYRGEPVGVSVADDASDRVVNVRQEGT